MKQLTIRLEDAEVETLERIMRKHGLSKAQGAFVMMVSSYESLENGHNYWQEQHDALAAEYQRLTEQSNEKIKLLREIIEEGLGRKVI